MPLFVRLSGVIRSLVSLSVFIATGLINSSYATDVDMGEFEAMPSGTHTFLMYYKTSRWDSVYSDGDKVVDDGRMEANIGILRYAYFVEKGGRLFVLPEFVLPFGEIKTTRNLDYLGDTHGVGDLIVPFPVFLVNNPAKKRAIVFNPIVHVPIGSYDNDDLLNLGENRWKYELQIGFVEGLGDKWGLDFNVGVQYFGDNTDFSSDSLTLEQEPLYKTQAFLNYFYSAETRFAIGVGYTAGGETTIGGIDQDNEISTTSVSLNAATLITPRDQLLISLRGDTSVRNGLKEEGRITLRWLHLF